MKQVHYYEPVTPGEKPLARMGIALRIIRAPARLILRYFMRLTVSGAEHFPQSGPALVLANHVNFFDPVLLILASGRPIQFLATRALLRAGPMGLLLKLFGIIPKKKFTADPTAIKTLKRWRDLDGAVGLFPEGERSWDGRPLPLVPGIEKLVRLVDAPVVTARILNGDRQWPRWAPHSRRGRVHVAFDPPRAFPRGTPLKEIRAYVEERIRVDTRETEHWEVRGQDLAVGATLVLFACPACGALEGLSERGDRLECGACESRWRLSAAKRLLPESTNGAEAMDLIEALDRMEAHLGPEWVEDPARAEAEGVLLESRPLAIHDITGSESSLVAEGRLRLTREALEIPGIWSLPLASLRVASVEMTDQLQLRTREHLFEVEFSDGESPIKWLKFVTRQQERAREG